MRNITRALGLTLACCSANAAPGARRTTPTTQPAQLASPTGAGEPSASNATPPPPPQLLNRPRSQWQTRGKSLSVAVAEDLVTSLQQAGWIAPDGIVFVERRGSYELLSFGVARDGREGSFEVLRPALSQETQFVPPRLRGARLDAAHSAHTYDAVGDTFVGVEMTGGGTRVRAAKLRDELIDLVDEFLFGEVRPTSRDFAENKEGNYPGATERVPASAFSLSKLSAVLQEAGWHIAAVPLPIFQLGAYEMVRCSTGRGNERAIFTLVRPASSPHLRTPFTPPAERGRGLDPSTSAFMHDDAGDIFAAVYLPGGGNSADAKELLQRLLTRASAPN